MGVSTIVPASAAAVGQGSKGCLGIVSQQGGASHFCTPADGKDMLLHQLGDAGRQDPIGASSGCRHLAGPNQVSALSLSFPV